MNLVTGSTGIVGSRLLFDLISINRPVRGLKRPNSDLHFVAKVFDFLDPVAGSAKFQKIEWVDGDVLDLGSLADALDGVTHVYHAAALVSYRPADAEKLRQVNGVGTANVVNLSLDAGVIKLCHISSIAALGNAPSGGMINEDCEWTREQNRSNYGLSKYLAEREVWRGTMEGLPAIILNPTIIIGPSKPDQSSGMLLNVIKSGPRAYPMGATGFIDVKDLSAAAIWLMDSQVQNERFVMNGENLSYKDLLIKGSTVYKTKEPTAILKPWMLQFAWRLLAFFEFLGGAKASVTKETARSSSLTQRYDHTKILKFWPGSFTPISESLSNYRSFEA